MANPQETSVKDFDLKKEICFDSIIIKLYDVPAKCKCNRNIVGENEKGELIGSSVKWIDISHKLYKRAGIMYLCSDQTSRTWIPA